MATTVEPTTNGVHGSTALAVRDSDDTGSIAAFASHGNFEAAQRIAKALALSTLVPKEYTGNIANCLVAMELASRTGASVLMVMQNLHVIQGRPSWSAAFLIACVNACGRFSSIRYEVVGDEPNDKGYKVRAYATEKATGERLYGTWITWAMVNAEGWLGKPGSKWKSMPGQMFNYRAAAFWVRSYCPEISLGMHTSDEARDITAPSAPSQATRELNTAIRGSAMPTSIPASEIEHDLSDLVAADEDDLTDHDAAMAKD